MHVSLISSDFSKNMGRLIGWMWSLVSFVFWVSVSFSFRSCKSFFVLDSILIYPLLSYPCLVAAFEYWLLSLLHHLLWLDVEATFGRQAVTLELPPISWIWLTILVMSTLDLWAHGSSIKEQLWFCSNVEKIKLFVNEALLCGTLCWDTLCWESLNNIVHVFITSSGPY